MLRISIPSGLSSSDPLKKPNSESSGCCIALWARQRQRVNGPNETLQKETKAATEQQASSPLFHVSVVCGVRPHLGLLDRLLPNPVHLQIARHPSTRTDIGGTSGTRLDQQRTGLVP